MKQTFENRINFTANGLCTAMNYLSDDLEAICDNTMREYAEETLNTIKKSAFHASFLKDHISLFLDALTDISVNVGWQQIESEDSRKRNMLIRQWAEEFVETHADTDWEKNDYIILIDEFSSRKLEEWKNVKNNQNEKKYKVSYVLGTEAVREYTDAVNSGETWSISSLCDCGAVSHGEFATQAELDAYKQGIEDATGYLESEEIMTDEEWNNYLVQYFSDEDDD